MTDHADDELAKAFDVDVDLPDTVDEAAVKRMQRVAYALDESVRVPGTDIRIGLDPIVGALPVAGDAVTIGLSLYVVVEAARLGVTYTTLLRMLANVTVDAAIGAVPVVGDAIDALWKANVRNVELALVDLATEGDGGGDDPAATVEIPVE